MDDFPPRGSGVEGRRERSPTARWLHPDKHGPEWSYQPGAVLLGQWQGKPRGWSDDRHLVTVAGSRAGKSRNVIIPNLLRYPGPVVVIDPKGELTAATMAARSRLGPSFVLDPFGVSPAPSSRFNPFDQLRRAPVGTLSADAAQIADALIIAPEKGDRHWTDSAKNLIAGLLLHFVTSDPARATVAGLRSALSSSPEEWRALFDAMAANEALDGVVSNVGRAYGGKVFDDGQFTGELMSIISTAAEQTRVLDDVAPISGASDFDLAGLSKPQNAPGAVRSLYLVLPGLRIGTHARWLRLVIYQALAALERAPVPFGSLPVLFVLEEFAALGKVGVIETAAGYMAGFGVKLWPVLQDLQQLKTHYPDSWETFLGNAGMIQAFGNVDVTTTEYLSKRMGETLLVERQQVQVNAQAMGSGDLGRREHLRSPPLLAPFEVAGYFSRQSGRVLLLAAGYPPTWVDRWQEKTPAG